MEFEGYEINEQFFVWKINNTFLHTYNFVDVAYRGKYINT